MDMSFRIQWYNCILNASWQGITFWHQPEQQGNPVKTDVPLDKDHDNGPL
jgi:hypothetical protein